MRRNHRQYQSTSYNQPYYNQLQQPNAYQQQYQADLCAGQDKFFNPPSVYNMGQNILNGLMGSNSPGGPGYGTVTVWGLIHFLELRFSPLAEINREKESLKDLKSQLILIFKILGILTEISIVVK